MSAPFQKKVLAEVLSGISQIVADSDGETLQRLQIVLQQRKAQTQSKRASAPTKRGTNKTSSPGLPLGGHMFGSDDELREKLYAFESREALSNFIDQTFPRKSDVIAASRIAKVAVNKNDDYDALVERLIDATIGYKLRSRAIRGDG